MNLKKTAWVLAASLLMAAVVAIAQDMPMPHNDDRWKELQSYRVWAIIQQLDLDARSERGIALLDVINKNSDKTRELLLAKQEKMHQLHEAFEKEPLNEEQVTSLIEGIEDLQKQLLEMQIAYHKQLEQLLSPVERAKLFNAEEIFRQRLRRAMQGGMRGRRGPGGPPSDRDNDNHQEELR